MVDPVRGPPQERQVTTAKRVGLVSVVLISVGASGAYFATMTAMKNRGPTGGGIPYLVIALVVALSALVMLVFYRSLHRAIDSIAGQ